MITMKNAEDPAQKDLADEKIFKFCHLARAASAGCSGRALGIGVSDWGDCRLNI